MKIEIENFKGRLYGPEQLRKLLKEDGFNAINMIKAFEHKHLRYTMKSSCMNADFKF